MIIEIAVGILLGYLLIRLFPYFWFYKWKIFFIILTICGFGIYFILRTEDSIGPEIALGVGFVSFVACIYLFSLEEDEDGSIIGFFKALKQGKI